MFGPIVLPNPHRTSEPIGIMPLPEAFSFELKRAPVVDPGGATSADMILKIKRRAPTIAELSQIDADVRRHLFIKQNNNNLNIFYIILTKAAKLYSYDTSKDAVEHAEREVSLTIKAPDGMGRIESKAVIEPQLRKLVDGENIVARVLFKVIEYAPPLVLEARLACRTHSERNLKKQFCDSLFVSVWRIIVNY